MLVLLEAAGDFGIEKITKLINIIYEVGYIPKKMRVYLLLLQINQVQQILQNYLHEESDSKGFNGKTEKKNSRKLRREAVWP